MLAGPLYFNGHSTHVTSAEHRMELSIELFLIVKHSVTSALIGVTLASARQVFQSGLFQSPLGSLRCSKVREVI